MRTKIDPDDDLYIPDVSGLDWSKSRPNPYARNWVDAEGRTSSVSAGPRLELWARLNNGEPQPCADRAPHRRPRRIAETA
jgi:hypothetical protein